MLTIENDNDDDNDDDYDGGGISSVVARGLVILWVTGSIPEVGESFRRRLKDSLIDWESAMGNS